MVPIAEYERLKIKGDKHSAAMFLYWVKISWRLSCILYIIVIFVKSIAWLHELCDIAGQSQPGITHTVQEAQECEQERKKLEGTAEVVTIFIAPVLGLFEMK